MIQPPNIVVSPKQSYWQLKPYRKVFSYLSFFFFYMPQWCKLTPFFSIPIYPLIYRITSCALMPSISDCLAVLPRKHFLYLLTAFLINGYSSWKIMFIFFLSLYNPCTISCLLTWWQEIINIFYTKSNWVMTCCYCTVTRMADNAHH